MSVPYNAGNGGRTVKGHALKGMMLLAMLAATGCCGMFQSKEERYKKEMECALRVTDERSIVILQKGMFCCEKLPAQDTTLPAARRFYLLRAAALEPKNPDPLMQIARSYWDDRDFVPALAFFVQAKELSPKPLAAVIGEITMLRLTKQWDKAMTLVAWIREQKAMDAPKVADYLDARLLYDQGKYAEAKPLFLNALKRAESGSDTLGDTPYTMKDTYLYLAQIQLKGGDPQGAYEDFKLFLKKTSNPDFQLFYNYWVGKLGSDQAALYDKIESDWAWPRQ